MSTRHLSLRTMNSRLTRYLACFILALGGTVFANDPFNVVCKKKCSSCESSSSCSPDSDTYEVVATFDTAEEAQAEADRLNGESDGDWKDCKVEASNSTANGGTHATTDTSPGLTPLNYKRQGLLFDGVAPDYVKYETVSETVNGVTANVKKPVQLPTKHSTIFYTDLPDGSGYQCAQYVNSQLSAPDAHGLRSIPAGVQATSITIYRNPEGSADTNTGKLDVIHKQRHPKTGEWVTRTIRKTSPQGNNNWSTKYYLGDPVQNPTLQPYREISITRTPNPNNVTEESTREIIRDRDSLGNLVITSDLSVTYGFYKYGEPVKLAETAHTGTASELTSTWTYYTAAADQASFNKPATLRRSDGQWANYTYQGSPVTGTLVTKTVSGWLDNAAPAVGSAPDENANRVVVEIEAKNETGTFSREEKVQGVLVSKTWGERYKDNSGMLVEKSRVETGSTTLTTTRTGWPNSVSIPVADRGRVKSIQFPDGTVELHTHALHGDNLVTTIDNGVGSLSGVTDGTRTVSTFTKHDTLIKEVVSDIASGIVLSTKEAIAFDADDQPTRWAFDNNPDDYSEVLKGCCGIDSERSRDGIVTTYTRDGLKRPKTAVSQGITLTYTYGKKTIGGTDFPSVNITATAGSLTLNKGTTVYDHAGNVIQQISPDLDGDNNEEITATARDFSTPTTTTTNPDGGTVISTDYADGQSKSTTGTATAPKFYQYATHAEQGGCLVSATASTATGPWTKTYENLAGNTLKTTFDDGSNETTLQTDSFDSFGRFISTTDADGVTQLIAYNTKGKAYRRAVDLNQNGQIDSTDRISDTLTDILEDQSFGPAIRTQTLLYDDTNTARVTSTTLQSPDGLLTRTSTLGGVTPSTSSRASYLDRSDGSWTDTNTAPDGTKTSVAYQNWQAVTQSRLDTANNVIESTTTGYDALLRPETRTDSRTASAVVTRTGYHASNGLVISVTEDLTTGADRVTSHTYDSMGRRTTTTLPDNSVTHTSYWSTGQEKASYGSQTNPTVKLYTAEGQLHKLRTFRSANLALAPDETTGNYDETTWVYNTRCQLERKEYADGKGTDYTYTPGGKLHTCTWARAVGTAPLVTTYGYSAAGELTTTDYSDTTPDVTIVTDKLGRQLSVTNGIAQSVFTYDPATLALDYETISYNLDGQLGFEFTRILDCSRDTLGRDVGFTLRSADVSSAPETQATYTYQTATGRLSTVSDGANTFTYSYIPNSNLIDAVTGPAHTVDNAWEPDRDILDFKENKVGSTAVSKYDYSVNALGQRSNVSQTGSAFTAARGIAWGYDSLGQVTSADSTENSHDRAYQYDAIGNRMEARIGVTAITGAPNYSANALNQYTSVPSVASGPSYDDDGNATSYPLPVAPTTNSTLVWDAENRLISAAVNGTTTTYLYDAQTRRIATTTGNVTTLFVYDGWNCVAKYVGVTVAETYTWGEDLSGSMQGAGGVGGLLAVKSGSTVRYPTFDGNGNVSEYLDSLGTTVAHFEYDPCGNTDINTDTAGQFAYRFSTKPIDAGTGLYYYGYRWYDAPNGRWPSRDPIEEEGGMNLYGFVENHGLDGWDRLGLEIDEFPEPKIKYWKKLDAETTSNWRVNPKKRKLWFKDKWEVSIKGKISPVKVTLDKRTENDITEDGKTVKEHELHHVELRKEAWNALRDKTHPYEGVYCDEPCAQIAHDLMVNYNAYYGSQSIKKNAQFDLDVYGKRLKKEDKNEYDRIESRRDLGQNGMEIAEKSLNTLLLQWKNKKCKKE